MEEKCLNRLPLSHTYRMENTERVTLTRSEAEEYCVYKRQRKISEIMSAMRRTESELSQGDSAVKLCEQALRLRQASIRLTPSELLMRGENFIKNGVAVDCIVGGNGETFPCVKAYEAKKAVRAGAKEITLIITPSHILNCRYGELKREIKKVRRAVKRAVLKVRVEKNCPQSAMEKLAKIASEQGAQYFSVPYFIGCEHLQNALLGGCLLEVSGIDSLALFKQMTGAGIGRIVIERAWERYSEWLKEVEEITVEKECRLPLSGEETKKKETALSPILRATEEKTHARLEGSDLKFI